MSSHSPPLLPPAALLPCFFPCCSDAVCIEVLTRQLANEGGPDALLSLCPWLEFVTIPTQVGGQRARAASHGSQPGLQQPIRLDSQADSQHRLSLMPVL
jgi:hypothetical protein